jgi:uncharacterized protein (DUF3820 family)
MNIQGTDNMNPAQKMLLELITLQMPLGKYEDTLICDLPVPYFGWFARKGFLVHF